MLNHFPSQVIKIPLALSLQTRTLGSQPPCTAGEPSFLERTSDGVGTDGPPEVPAQRQCHLQACETRVAKRRGDPTEPRSTADSQTEYSLLFKAERFRDGLLHNNR